MQIPDLGPMFKSAAAVVGRWLSFKFRFGDSIEIALWQIVVFYFLVLICVTLVHLYIEGGD